MKLIAEWGVMVYKRWHGDKTHNISDKMAAYFKLKFKQNLHLREIFIKRNQEEVNAERDAAIKIQSWYRAIRVQNYIRFLNKCAIIIQKTFRGYSGRIIYRNLVKKKLQELAKLYYDRMAILIQCRWRGYYVRKYKFNYYARKNYLEGLVIKNEIFRKELERINYEKIAIEEADRLNKQQIQDTYKNRKTHYLLSTQVCPGIYNSPKEENLERERALSAVLPLSKEERYFMGKAKKEAFLRTVTGIPVANDLETTIQTNKPKLPPIKNTPKPQGPFRSPTEVRKQRYKELQPTLRVATDYECVEKSRKSLREEDWTKRIIDESFLPSTRRVYPYKQSLDSTVLYGRPEYGTKHFRVTQEKSIKSNKPFQRVVSPIPLFDQLGKTY